MKLFYAILGATPPGRNIEQHDVFFGIAEKVEDLYNEMRRFWSDAKIHIDCFQEVLFVDGYEVKIIEGKADKQEEQLFFINLGGYKPGHFTEYHEMHLMIGPSLSEVIKRVKKTEFYMTMGFKNAMSHIDEKFGVDIDDIYNVNDLLSDETKAKYSIVLEKSDAENQENPMKIGYHRLR